MQTTQVRFKEYGDRTVVQSGQPGKALFFGNNICKDLGYQAFAHCFAERSYTFDSSGTWLGYPDNYAPTETDLKYLYEAITLASKYVIEGDRHANDIVFAICPIASGSVAKFWSYGRSYISSCVGNSPILDSALAAMLNYCQIASWLRVAQVDSLQSRNETCQIAFRVKNPAEMLDGVFQNLATDEKKRHDTFLEFRLESGKRVILAVE